MNIRKMLLQFVLSICTFCIVVTMASAGQSDVEGIAEGILDFKGRPMQTLRDGKFVTVGIIPADDNALRSRSPDGSEFRAPIGKFIFDMSTQNVPFVIAWVKGKTEGIVHLSSLKYEKAEHEMLQPTTVVVEPLLDAAGKPIQGLVRIGHGSELTIFLADRKRSLLAFPGNSVTLAPQAALEIDGIKVSNTSGVPQKYSFVLETDSKLVLKRQDRK